MKKHSKFSILLMSLTLVLSMSLNAFATNSLIGQDIGKNEPINPPVLKEDLFITENVAEKIAELFIKDIIATNLSCWDNNTTIENSVVMYDETNTNTITAYTFELNSGYVVVAGYLDAPSIILEWSDKAQPLYKVLDLSSKDKVVYLGSLNYYKDSGKAKIEQIDGTSINRSEVQNIIAQKSNIGNVDKSILETILNRKEKEKNDPTVSLSKVIQDPYVYANDAYGGSWSCNDYYNEWGTWANDPYSWRDGNVNGDVTYEGCCGPVAITNLLLMYGKRFNASFITSPRPQDIMFRVADLGISKGYYSSGWGTDNATAGSYIYDSFADFGIRVSTSSQLPITYDNVRTSLLTSRLLYLELSNHQEYGDHAVVCFAYTRLRSDQSGYFKTFLKISDGIEDYYNRYLDLAQVNGNYFDVGF